MKIRTWTEKESTWAELKALAKAGKLGEVLNSGDNIPAALKNGEEVSFDVGRDESGKVYFILHDCLAEPRQMNNGWTNKGGWEECDMRKWLNTEAIELLPDELQEVIEPTKIVQVWDGKRRETEDKLFLLSRTQVFGKNEAHKAIEPEDSQIDIFQTERSRVKERKGYGTAYWWERSPRSGNSYIFCRVTSGGRADIHGASYTRGVALGFCI